MFKVLTSLRYTFSRKSAQKTVSMLISLSVALGIFGLIVIIAVLNGMQNSQTDILRSVESFDLIVTSTDLSEEELTGLSSGTVYEFADLPAMLSSDMGAMSIRIRAIEGKYFADSRVKHDVFPLGIPSRGLCPSFYISSRTGTIPGQEVSLTVLKKGKTATLVPFEFNLNVSNSYSCNLSDFSKTTCYSDIEEIREITGIQDVSYGIFSSDRSSVVKERILSKDPEAEVTTWQEYNNAIYSALLLEKILVYVFLGFIFLIICAGLRDSTKRLIRSKSKESAVLLAQGMTLKSLHGIYLLQSLFITLPGLIAGSFLGKLIVRNIDKFLNGAGNLITGITGRYSVLNSMPFKAFISFSEILIVSAVILVLAIIYTLSAMKEFRKNTILEVLSNVGT